MITVYGYSPSGNCHKLRMLLGHLGRDYRWIETDSAHGATRTPEYLAKNPNGRVPMIELDDGRIMVESNAILCWLADGTQYFAGDAWHHIIAVYHASGTQTIHDSLTVDGTTYPVNLTHNALFTGNGLEFTNAFQVDLNGSSTPYQVYIDNMTVTRAD